jgi:hypothetical protein
VAQQVSVSLMHWPAMPGSQTISAWDPEYLLILIVTQWAKLHVRNVAALKGTCTQAKQLYPLHTPLVTLLVQTPETACGHLLCAMRDDACKAPTCRSNYRS